MKKTSAKYLSENMDRLSRRDRVLLNNPVMMQGLGLAAIVLPATSVQNAFVMAVAVLLLLTPTRIIASFVGRFTGFYFRAITYVLTAGALYIGVSYIIDRFIGLNYSSVGIYLPILVMEPLIIKRYENPQPEPISVSLRKGLVTTAGFCLVLFLVAAIRELLATGSIMGFDVAGSVQAVDFALLPMAASPAGGFIIIGLLMAVWRSAVNVFKKRVSLGAKTDD